MSLTKASYSMINGASVNVLDFGAKGTALVDDTAAIQAAIDYASTFTNGAIVYFPSGTYLVSETLTVSHNYIWLQGSGRGNTVLIRNANYGNTLTISNGVNELYNVKVTGFTFYHDNTTNGMDNAHISADSVSYLDLSDLMLTNGKYGVICYAGVYANINNIHFFGSWESGSATKNSTVGLYLRKTSLNSSVKIPTIYNVTNCQFNGWTGANQVYQYGCVINAVEEIHFTNCTFNVGPSSNVYIQQLADNAFIAEITFTTCFFDASSQNSVWIDGGLGNGSSYIARVRFIGCGFNGETFAPYYAPGLGLFVDGTNRGGAYPQALNGMEIIGCTFEGYYNQAAWFAGGNDITMTGCTFIDNNISNSADVDDIVIGANVTKINIVGNNIGGSTGTATGKTKYGINLLDGCDYVNISNNVIIDTVTGAILDFSTTTNKRITDNLGFNGNRASTAPTIPSSGVNYTNPYGSPAVVSFVGGTVTSIKLNGTQMYANTSGPSTIVNVGANDVLNITYSVAPSWIWWPQ